MSAGPSVLLFVFVVLFFFRCCFILLIPQLCLAFRAPTTTTDWLRSHSLFFSLDSKTFASFLSPSSFFPPHPTADDGPKRLLPRRAFFTLTSLASSSASFSPSSGSPDSPVSPSSSTSPASPLSGEAADDGADLFFRSEFLRILQERGFIAGPTAHLLELDNLLLQERCTQQSASSSSSPSASSSSSSSSSGSSSSPPPLSAYMGVDLNHRSLHAGHLLPLLMLRWWRRCGHRPVLLLGGATTPLGDPAGKDKPAVKRMIERRRGMTKKRKDEDSSERRASNEDP